MLKTQISLQLDSQLVNECLTTNVYGVIYKLQYGTTQRPNIVNYKASELIQTLGSQDCLAVFKLNDFNNQCVLIDDASLYGTTNNHAIYNTANKVASNGELDIIKGCSISLDNTNDNEYTLTLTVSNDMQDGTYTGQAPNNKCYYQIVLVKSDIIINATTIQSYVNALAADANAIYSLSSDPCDMNNMYPDCDTNDVYLYRTDKWESDDVPEANYPMQEYYKLSDLQKDSNNKFILPIAKTVTPQTHLANINSILQTITDSTDAFDVLYSNGSKGMDFATYKDEALAQSIYDTWKPKILFEKIQDNKLYGTLTIRVYDNKDNLQSFALDGTRTALQLRSKYDDNNDFVSSAMRIGNTKADFPFEAFAIIPSTGNVNIQPFSGDMCKFNHNSTDGLIVVFPKGKRALSDAWEANYPSTVDDALDENGDPIEFNLERHTTYYYSPGDIVNLNCDTCLIDFRQDNAVNLTYEDNGNCISIPFTVDASKYTSSMNIDMMIKLNTYNGHDDEYDNNIIHLGPIKYTYDIPSVNVIESLHAAAIFEEVNEELTDAIPDESLLTTDGLDLGFSATSEQI